MRRTLPLALAAAMAFGNFAFTGTDVGGDRVFFECTGASPFNNLESATASWSEEAPGGSMGSGSGGCFTLDAYPDSAEAGDAMVDSVFTGTYEGAIDSIALHLYVGSFAEQYGADPSAGITIVVDGTTVYSTPEEAHILARTGDGPFQQTSLWETTITNLGVGAGTHDVQITYSDWFTDDLHFVMWGASDADSGISFNPTGKAGTVVRA